jgi:hypothetical protein
MIPNAWLFCAERAHAGYLQGLVARSWRLCRARRRAALVEANKRVLASRSDLPELHLKDDAACSYLDYFTYIHIRQDHIDYTELDKAGGLTQDYSIGRAARRRTRCPRVGSTQNPRSISRPRCYTPATISSAETREARWSTRRRNRRLCLRREHPCSRKRAANGAGAQHQLHPRASPSGQFCCARAATASPTTPLPGLATKPPTRRY